MMKFGDLRTVVKLMLAFGLVGVINAGVGAFGITTVSTVNEKVGILYERELKGLSAIKDVNLAITGISRLTRAAIISTDQKEKEQFIKDIAKLKQQFTDRLSDFKKLIVLAEVKATAAELEQIFPPYMVMMEDAAQLALRGDNANAIKKVHEAIPSAQQVMSRATTLAALKEKRAEEVYKESNAEYESSRNILVGLSAAGVCLGLILGWVISKMISQSLANLGTAVLKLEGGDLKARASVDSKDEIGQLAQSFNKMGEQLEHMVKHQEGEIAAKTAEVSGLTNAISRSQAVVEFNLDGTILTANENFLQYFGYRLDELTGHHDRMLCSQVEVNSSQYQALWNKVIRGEFEAGVYPRIRKDGKEIWLQASYAPILDAQGKVHKIVMFALNISEQRLKALEYEGKIHAANRAQAIIEFSLDGTVLTANENFLRMFGYALNEIKGRHHRMFCDPTYAGSGDYTHFWQKLERGEFVSMVCQQVGKAAQELWIQATYSPIQDLHGNVYKIVEYATDITQQKLTQMEMERLVAESEMVLGKLAVSDLTQEMTGTYRGELEKVKTSINAVVRNLIQTITTVREVVESVASGSEQINKGNADLSQRTSEQAGSLEETASSMQEMTETVRQNADNAKQANQLAIKARETADKGGDVTQQAVAAMMEINKSSKKIADIITVIDEIAFQTNLLALNAAVEAARAGEHGRGFAVVAAEVRNLAGRSALAAKEIKGLIHESIQRVTDGSELVNQSGKTLEEIVHSVKQVTDIIAEISAASQEQASGVDQVNTAIMQVDQVMQQNAALVEEITSASHSMKGQSEELLRRMVSFKLTLSEAEKAAIPSIAAVREHAARSISRAFSESTVKSNTIPPSVPKPRATKPATLTVGADSRQASQDDFEEF